MRIIHYLFRDLFNVYAMLFSYFSFITDREFLFYIVYVTYWLSVCVLFSVFLICL